MFSRSKQTKPLKAVPLKFVKEGENLDVANSIMSVEMSGASKTKTPKVSRTRKSSTMSSQRRSASIERIFEKQKQSETKIKEDLQKHLQELRAKEHSLMAPPPPVSKLPPPPPPPPPPVSLAPKVRKIAPSKTIIPKGAVNQMAAISLGEITKGKSSLRKVHSQEIPEVKKDEDDVLDLIKFKLQQIRPHLEVSSDEDDEVESSSDEEF
ncbi:hypothetical protein TVAG_030590 [Trichomonas vaginalis G3]|uniref:WH2 motif family protein n=1 Tax=Trichomonas vaginalis (strain ATCC PRA-98 / G3) TaxID=412133 RepID=A2EY98_TRIV3|nr:hypothetical protein TVAGG3_0868330 [Trichomonas vaginalis G3]EAY02386.1 hypothetical protein TVAG_030590 [Trichomonas vaginalis G3]KAI5501192.1 hypothetical protein TVAGG3_0868330 [Trichomonas vaginalis G3]|eukprot:XP_001330647.1 hypothetical protein [Trichomonas vaginalis G3]